MAYANNYQPNRRQGGGPRAVQLHDGNFAQLNFRNMSNAAPARRAVFAGLGALLGDVLGPDALAQAAQVIVAQVGSLKNPITPAMESAAGYVNVVDTQYGGSRAVPFYNANPVADPSGLFLWTGSDSGQPPPGLSAAQLLAMQVLLNGGDTSFSADYHPASPLEYQAPQNTAPAAVVQNYAAPLPTPTVNNAVLDQSGAAIANTYGPMDPRTYGMTSDQFDAYLRSHGGFPPGDPRGDPAPLPASTFPITTQGADAIVAQVAASGGDPTQPTGVVDATTGKTVATVQQAPDGSTIMKAGGGPLVSLENLPSTVADWFSHIGDTIQNVGQQAQKVGNAVKGAAAGAEAGYNAPLNLRPWIIGGAAVAGVYLLTRRR